MEMKNVLNGITHFRNLIYPRLFFQKKKKMYNKNTFFHSFRLSSLHFCFFFPIFFPFFDFHFYLLNLYRKIKMSSAKIAWQQLLKLHDQNQINYYCRLNQSNQIFKFTKDQQ